MPDRVVVIGGGITGLAAAHRLRARLGPGRVVLLESSSRLGGKIETERHSGFTLEMGPDCFLASKPAGVTFCRELGIADRLISTTPQHRGSFVKRHGRLYPLPDGMSGLVPSRVSSLLTSRLLSVRGRLRAAMEPMIPARRGGTDESVADFARRRFGHEAYDWLLEPLLSGIHAGNGEELSVRAAFPKLHALEHRRGSIVGTMVRDRQRADNAPGTPLVGFVTLPEGLNELVDAAAASLDGVEVRRGCHARSVSAREGVWQVFADASPTIVATGVVITTPPDAAAELTRIADPALAHCLERIPHVSTAVISVAFRTHDVPSMLQGYGYLSPRAAGGSVVACTFTSNKFATRAPDDAVLLRCFVGRAGRDRPAGDTDDMLVALVRAELRATLGIEAAPTLTRVRRWPRGLPQYVVGHDDRMQQIATRLASLPGLWVTGAACNGVGIPDCIASGQDVADRVGDYVMTR